MAWGEAISSLLRIWSVWFAHRYDPEEVKRRRVAEVREDTDEKINAFRDALFEEDTKKAGQLFWKMFRGAEAQI